MTGDPRPCPRRGCNGTLTPTEQGTLNGVLTIYWDCNHKPCDYWLREEHTSHDEPTLDID